MGYYRPASGSDRAKAIAAVAIVHLALAAVILTGLNVRMIAQNIEALKSFDVVEDPPPPEPPVPMREPQRAKEEEGAAGKRAEPTPIVTPKPVLIVPAKPPVAAAPVAGAGVASNSGASTVGSGPGAGGPQTASAVLGDLVSVMTGQDAPRGLEAKLEVVQDVASAFYLHLEVADEPGVLAQVAQILGLQGASIKSVVQKGLGNDARLVMVMHPVAESKFFAALELISGLDFLRGAPRAIRVIEEEFV